MSDTYFEISRPTFSPSKKQIAIDELRACRALRERLIQLAVTRWQGASGPF